MSLDFEPFPRFCKDDLPHVLKPAPAHTTPQRTRWRFYTRPDAAWNAMAAACAVAKTSIDLEQYFIRPNAICTRLFILLMKKAHEGIQVRVLADPFGSYPLLFSRWPQRLRQAGVHFHFYNAPWITGHLRGVLPRDHRKFLIVDQRTAYTGGVCIDQRMATWRDTAVRIRGPLVAECVWTFNCIWDETCRREPVPKLPPLRGDGLSTLLTSDPSAHRNVFFEALLRELEGAQETVLLTSPYFIVHERLTNLLGQLARQGVQVHVIFANRSHPGLRALALLSAPELLAAGVHLWLYDRTMLHAKTAVIDNRWASIGSSNLDYLSLFGNQEANLVTTDPVAVTALAAHFAEDCRHAVHLTATLWRQRPWWQKLYGQLLRPVRKIL
jgi:cardiolipin synthase